MARRYFQKIAVLAKVETTYGTDAAPTAAANALLLNNATLTPLEGQKVSRDLMLPYYGDQGFVLAATYARLEASIEIAGAGAAGTAPGYGALLRACGLAELITVGSKVDYVPVSKNAEAVTLYAYLDGVLHAMVGCRGTVSLTVAPSTIPRFRFVLSGLLGPISDAALPGPQTLTAFQKPLVSSKANSTFSLHGVAPVLESLSLDLGNQVEPRMLIGSESIEIVDRSVTGTAVIEADSMAAKNWFTIARTSVVGALSCVHGTVAGNIVEFAAPAAQIGQPTYGNTQKILNHSLPLTLCPVSGDDELVIRVR